MYVQTSQMSAKQRTLISLAGPAANLVLAVLLLKNEKLMSWNWIGVILIVAGAYLVAYRPANP